MSNDYFNFTIPNFNLDSGIDWNAFKTIIDDNVDHIINKTVALYRLKDPSRMTARALDVALALRGIETIATDTVLTKKTKVRRFGILTRRKSLVDTYLDLGEAIVGTRGYFVISNASVGWTWGAAAGIWGTGIFGGLPYQAWNVYFNCKTTDTILLDAVEAMIRESVNRPAFYQVSLIDDGNNILRVI